MSSTEKEDSTSASVGQNSPQVGQDAELEAAKRRIQRMRGEESSAVHSIASWWRDFRQMASDRGEDIHADIEKGRRILEERKAKDVDDREKSLPLVMSLPSNSASAPLQRGLTGLNATFPFVGILAGISTYEIMKAERECSIYHRSHGPTGGSSSSPLVCCAGVPIDTDVVTRGCLRGVLRWLPLGAGSAVFYVIEPLMRSWFPQRELATKPVDAAARGNGLPSVLGQQEGAPDATFGPSSWMSRSAAGATAGAAVSLPLYMLRLHDVKSPSMVLALIATCAVGGTFMPDFERTRTMF